MNQVQRVTTPNLPAPSHVGQATAIEQSRAVAEVHAAIVVAQQCPRSLTEALRSMRESCAQLALAQRAFYKFPRAGQSVAGPSVHLARELARCWGNIQYGVAELRRDDEAGFSEMQAFAWDVQTNTRSAQIFVVPHKRDKKGGAEKLGDLRDIYENNANNGSRRLREAIFSVLPPWFVEEAKDLCNKALVDGDGTPMAQRVTVAIKSFDGLGVSLVQLEQKVGRASDKWTEQDVAQLAVTYKSLQRGEVTRDEEFPVARVTAAEILRTEMVEPASNPVVAPPAANGDRFYREPNLVLEPVSGPPADSAPVAAERQAMTKAQQGKMHALFNEVDLTDRDQRMTYVNEILADAYGPGRQVESSNELSREETGKVIDKLQTWATGLKPTEQELADATGDVR